ncbi:MAG TPA: hypothetical protein ENK66_03655 [Arcobacter sp.]|jgi:hypothetical protein|nr:hypothetical protein [Arcobacter sp.]
MDIDNISENDLMNALGDLGSSISSDTQNESNTIEETRPVIEEISSLSPETTNNTINVSSDSLDSLVPLLKELLANKTLEITIKIKD